MTSWTAPDTRRTGCHGCEHGTNERAIATDTSPGFRHDKTGCLTVWLTSSIFSSWQLTADLFWWLWPQGWTCVLRCSGSMKAELGFSHGAPEVLTGLWSMILGAGLHAGTLQSLNDFEAMPACPRWLTGAAQPEENTALGNDFELDRTVSEQNGTHSRYRERA